MTERLLIDRLAARGDGVADTSAGPVFVPYTLPGETVSVEPVPGRHPDRRHLVAIETASPERIEPICPHFGVCGGCAMQHRDYARYQDWKRGLLIAALEQAHIDGPVDALVDAHGEGRRRLTLHARTDQRGVTEVGFSTLRAHQIVGIEKCPVLAPSLDRAIPAAWAIAEELETTRKPLDIQITATDVGLDMDVRGSGALDSRLSARLARVAEGARLARLTRHGELVSQRAQPSIMMGKARVNLPAGAFLQATTAGETELAKRVEAHVGKAKTVADLFCGIGPFALRLAERSRVFAADSDEPAISALKQAAQTTSGLKPVEAEKRDLFRRPLVASELNRFDAVVFDPPRQGAEAQAQELARSKVPAIAAVSCNPATFARDARILLAGGYKMTAATPIDQFRYSPHVEIAARFER
jgi:23S rRNA (uracil1939-C5)-methyltransferase